MQYYSLYAVPSTALSDWLEVTSNRDLDLDQLLLIGLKYFIELQGQL